MKGFVKLEIFDDGSGGGDIKGEVSLKNASPLGCMRLVAALISTLNVDPVKFLLMLPLLQESVTKGVVADVSELRKQTKEEG